MKAADLKNAELSPDRMPPQSVEAEVAVLGAMLLDREAIHRSLEVIDRDVFHRPNNRHVFDAILSLYEEDQAVDLVTVAEELQRRGKLEAVGGAVFLESLVSNVATVANVAHHSRIVQEKAVLRRLIRAATRITTSAFEGKDNAEEILDRAEQEIFRISESRMRQSFVTAERILKDAFVHIEELHERKCHVTGISTGFNDLDVKTAGFQRGDLVVVAGRPSMGKTSFCLNICQHAAIENRVPVAIFSLEMSKEQLGLRLLCAEARVPGHTVRTGYLAESDWPRLTIAAGRLSDAPIYIDDSPAISVLEMRAKARRLKAEVDLGLVVVDYLQLVRSSQPLENRQQEISHISRSLKAMARELEVPVIAGSQLSRAVESRGGSKRPQLSDLRESGAIEQDADTVLFIFRPEVYERTPENEGRATMILAKQRNGPTGDVELAFVSDYARFENLARVTE